MEKIERRGFFRGVLGSLAAPFLSKMNSKNSQAFDFTEIKSFGPGDMIRAQRLDNHFAESLTNPTTDELIDGMVKSEKILAEIKKGDEVNPRIYWDTVDGEWKQYSPDLPEGMELIWDGNRWCPAKYGEISPLLSDEVTCRGGLDSPNLSELGVEYIVAPIGVYGYNLEGWFDLYSEGLPIYEINPTCNLI